MVLTRSASGSRQARIGFAGRIALLLAASALAPASAAGRGDASGGLGERRAEMRRQLFEHQQQWRRPAPDLRSPAAAAGGGFAPPAQIVPGFAPGLAPAPRPPARLSDDERDQLRRQLRQVPRFEAPNRD